MKKIIYCLLYLHLIIVSIHAQDNSQSKSIEFSISTIRTELKNKAIAYGLSYIRSLDSLLAKQDYLKAWDRSMLFISPRINMVSGNQDAFSSITAQLSGLLMTFDTVMIAGQITPNSAKTFHTFPISAGMETNNRFNTMNGLLELGWVPWYWAEGRNNSDWIKRTKFGLFLQGGYKLLIDTSGITTLGGEVDESKEKLNQVLLRAKASFNVNTQTLFKFEEVGIGLVGDAHAWYDFISQTVYYSLQGKLRLYLNQKKDRFFDFHYQKGSGAPNFNQGEQFGLGLTVTF